MRGSVVSSPALPRSWSLRLAARASCAGRRVLALVLALVLLPTCSGSEPAGSDSDSDSDNDDDNGASATDTSSFEVGEPTWHQDIAPIVLSRCGGCHRDGGIAPFSLQTHEQAAPWAALMLAAVEAAQMPPFAADETETCAPLRPWRDDPRLDAHERALLRAWVNDGAPAGDASAPAPIPEPPALTLTDAELLLTPGALIVDGVDDQFLCFSLDPQLDEDRYLAATQVIAGNDRVVHHVLVYADDDGSSSALAEGDGAYPCASGGLHGDTLVAAWAPGAQPNRAPEGSAFRLRAGSRLVMSVHYHPTGGGPETDPGTTLALEWYDGEPEFLSELALLGNFEDERLLPGPSDVGAPDFFIPAGAEHHSELMAVPIPDEVPELYLWMVGAHMHYVGVDEQLSLVRPAAREDAPEAECLLQTPHYQFEWQRTYAYDTPLADAPIVRGGDTLLIRCTYNNSLENPALVQALAEQGLDAPRNVFLGDDTLDEMCVGIYGVAYPRALADSGLRP